MTDDEVVAAVYGELYASSKTQMDLVDAAIEAQRNKGFKDADECAKWAKENLLDLLAFSKSQHQLLNITPKGELLTLSAWKRYFSTDLLFWWKYVNDDTQQPVPWAPLGLEYGNNAKIVGERSDGIRKPLYHRDYFTPTGYFDKLNETFNVAKPFPVYAKETHRDTSHIYEYIANIGGECAQHLLAWLRFKCMYPKQKTEVVPVIVSRTQGNGKTTFAEVICKGLFGEDNVLVTDQYDANARFNADYADALVVCAEEKEDTDKRSTSAALKSRSTGKTIRKEHKGVDPIYQENYSEFIVTTNKDVPIRFEGEDRQRRFMVMGSNPDFIRDNTDTLADEVFTKLYGADKNGRKVGVPFVEDKELIAQFKHELYQNKDLANLNLHDFPLTEEYKRCQSLPRTNEATEVDAILRTLAPFIKQSLIEHKIAGQVSVNMDGQEEVLSLSHYLPQTSALQYMGSIGTEPAYVALCKPIVFFDQQTMKPFNHATVERSIIDCSVWLLAEYGIRLLQSQLPIPGGFMRINSRYRQAPAARFALAVDVHPQSILPLSKPEVPAFKVTPRIGERLRVNGQWKPDSNGEFETVNEMKPGVNTLQNKGANVQYMDTFLFEADDTDKQTYIIETQRLKSSAYKQASSIFAERLRLQKAEADRLLNDGIACRVVYSGGKSYHVLVRIQDAPNTIDEYKWLHAHLCNGVLSTKLDFDPQCNDPARLTRAPVERERIFNYQGMEIHGIQNLYREAPGNVYNYIWRPFYQKWLDRPPEPYEQNGKKLRPVKPEYRDAMWALLSGTFWTDRTWHGRRQQCFFPAYRLCRMLGYSHDQLWSRDGILDGLNKYYRRNEVDYWRTREKSAIIEQIDKDVALQQEEENNGSAT